jgi:hypothetical protein
MENEPVLGVTLALGLGLCVVLALLNALGFIRRDPATTTAVGFALALIVPFAATYSILGVPKLALWLPVLAGVPLLFAAGALPFVRHVPLLRALLTATLLTLLAVQVWRVAPARWEEARTEDPLRTRAETVDAVLPPDAVIVAGSLAAHIDRYTDRRVVPLIPRLRRITAQPQSPEEVVGIVADILRPHAAAGRSLFITEDAAHRLFGYTLRSRASEEDAHRILLLILQSPEPAFVVGSPPIRIFRMTTPPPAPK